MIERTNEVEQFMTRSGICSDEALRDHINKQDRAIAALTALNVKTAIQLPVIKSCPLHGAVTLRECRIYKTMDDCRCEG